MALQNVQLREIVEYVIDHRGKTPLKLGGSWTEFATNHPVLSAKNIKTGRIISKESIRFVDEDLYKLWMQTELKIGDILVTSEAPFGQLYYWDLEEKAVLGQRLFGLHVREEVNSKFLYYYMQTPKFQRELESRATGTTVLGLRQPELLKCTVALPSRREQDKCAEILGQIDKKIRVNESVNDNLQLLAQTIYQAMFIDEAQSKVYQATLKDLAEITMGQSPNGKSYNTEGKGTVFYQGRADFGKRFPAPRLFTTEPKRIAEKGDILLSVRAPVGDLNIAYESCCIGRGLGAIRSKTEHHSFLFYTMLSLRSQFEVYNSEGTVFGSINKKELCDISINIPSTRDLENFECIVRPIDNLIYLNFEENRRLQHLRDNLLKRLLNGNCS